MAKGGTNDLANLQTICPSCNYQFDRVLEFVANPSRELARGWITAFLKAPIITASISVLLAASLGIVVNVWSSQQRKDRETQRLAGSNYVAQLGKLNETEQRLRELLSFVGDQREALKQNEDAIAALKSQQESLAPLVASDQRVVDALFAAQEQRNQKAVKRERWFGFGLGVFSSIVASTLVGIATFFLKKRRVIARFESEEFHEP